MATAGLGGRPTTTVSQQAVPYRNAGSPAISPLIAYVCPANTICYMETIISYDTTQSLIAAEIKHEFFDSVSSTWMLVAVGTYAGAWSESDRGKRFTVDGLRIIYPGERITIANIYGSGSVVDPNKNWVRLSYTEVTG